MNTLSHLWPYLVLATLVGALLPYLIGRIAAGKSGSDLQREPATETREAVTPASVEAGTTSQAGIADYERRIIGLERELAMARTKADELAAAKAKVQIDQSLNAEDIATMKWRNRYLQARVTFLEGQAGLHLPLDPAQGEDGVDTSMPDLTEAEAITNQNFTPSSLASLSGAEMEAATLAATARAIAPPRLSPLGPPDDLLLIDGVGPKNKAWLNEQGIYYFHQIATLTIEQVAWLAEHLPTFGSRVYRENWVAQCTNLARGLPARG
jgi:predicted flap endonuclease-1-like 5' DNA nuclease